MKTSSSSFELDPPIVESFMVLSMARRTGYRFMMAVSPPWTCELGRPTESPSRAPNVPPSTVNSGCWRSVAVTVNEYRGLARKRETAGQRGSDLRWEWWPGAGSNRRPSDFQA
jgi:hypothetical protein